MFKSGGLEFSEGYLQFKHCFLGTQSPVRYRFGPLQAKVNITRQKIDTVTQLMFGRGRGNR